jgi:hypothetical protein
MGTTPTLWLVLAFGGRRQYAGNAGYADEPTKVYRYDNQVANHKRVKTGDLMIVRDHSQMLGAARIESIVRTPAAKEQARCPEEACHTTAIKARQQKHPRFRCANGHEFERPDIRQVPVTAISANFGKTFVAAPGAIALEQLRHARPRPADQLAIQEISPGAVARRLSAASTGIAALLADCMPIHTLLPHEGIESPNWMPWANSEGEGDPPALFAHLRQRRGQTAFRNGLIQRYGRLCMISGCNVLDVIEAAHIIPYAGPRSNHPENGLLLRADIHTLWDLNRLAIHPDSLCVTLDASLAMTEYSAFSLGTLKVERAQRPSNAALQYRWQLFLDVATL